MVCAVETKSTMVSNQKKCSFADAVLVFVYIYPALSRKKTDFLAHQQSSQFEQRLKLLSKSGHRHITSTSFLHSSYIIQHDKPDISASYS